ncbi:MAG: type II toxin-antitoxin system mRNA interferase toxin, RelE/StbE family [Patescibacteria group bacterium]
MESKLSNNFRKSFRKLHSRIQEKAAEKISIFEQNPFDPRLDTHELHGKDRDIWSFSITGSYRIKFIFLDSNNVLFIEIGTHDIYK